MMLSNCFLTCTALVHAAAGSGEDHGAKKDLRDEGLILVKIWCLIIVFLVTFAGGISPYFWRWNRTFIVLGTQFAGGVFLGTALMHFLSDSNQTFQDLGVKDYPFAFMLCSVGYVVTMLGDCILVWVNQSNSVGNVCGEGKEQEDEEDGGEGINGGGTNRRRASAGESAVAHIGAELPLGVRGNGGGRCGEQGWSVESTDGGVFAQGVCGRSHGNRSAPDDAQQAIPVVRGICLRVWYIEPRRSKHRHRRGVHDREPRSSLVVRNYHGFGNRDLHLRCPQPSAR